MDLRDFNIGLQIGSGSFAIVRRCVHKESGALIALKTYEKKNLMKPEAANAVHSEINNLAELDHPNIMRLYEVIDSRTHVHLVTELCSGTSLFHYTKKLPDQRMPEDTCRVVFRQLMLAVGFMHSKGVVHRDLKLDNILIDAATKKIKIIDFGFSLNSKPQQKLDSYCGTPHYMCPDIVKKTPYSGFAADIWACGVILYILSAGRLPFFGEFEADLYRKISIGKYKPLPADVGDQSIRGLFNSIFTPNSRDRATADDILRHSWLKTGFEGDP